MNRRSFVKRSAAAMVAAVLPSVMLASPSRTYRLMKWVPRYGNHPSIMAVSGDGIRFLLLRETDFYVSNGRLVVRGGHENLYQCHYAARVTCSRTGRVEHMKYRWPDAEQQYAAVVSSCGDWWNADIEALPTINP